MSYTFIGVGRTQEYPEKTIDLPQLIDKLYHIFRDATHSILRA